MVVSEIGICSAAGRGRPGGALRRRVVPTWRYCRAFTLVEMLVSLAVLTLALGMVGMVFSVTTKTASQAAAYSEAHNWVRQFLFQLEADLKDCNPSESILVLVGRTQPAALTQAHLDAGQYFRVLVGNPLLVPPDFDPLFSDPPADPYTDQYSEPRADLMMFFSQRQVASQAPPPPDVANPLHLPFAYGLRSSPIQVVYGHAAIGEATWNGSDDDYDWAWQHIENPDDFSTLPATRWHLARRATIIESDPSGTRLDFEGGGGPDSDLPRIVRCLADDLDADGDWEAGDVARLNYQAFLDSFGYVPPLTDLQAVDVSPYDFASGTGPPNWENDLPALHDRVLNVMYLDGDDEYHHVATVLERVPVDLRSNLGVHLLPGCVWFQVEFLMPEDPRNSFEYDDPIDDPGDEYYSERGDLPRWTAVEDGDTYVFVPDTQENRELVAEQVDAATGEPVGGSRLDSFAMLDPTMAVDVDPIGNRVIRMWPYAIRVTVRVFDPRGRLDVPIVRTLVHRFE